MKKLQQHIPAGNRVGYFYWLIPLLTVMLFSCKKEVAPVDTANSLSAADEMAALQLKKPGAVVWPGASIQAAVNAAAPGSTIYIEPGTYMESILVNKAGIQLIGLLNGKKKVIIKNPDDEENGIEVTSGGNGFVLRNVTVEGFEENGVLLTGVDGFTLDHVDAINNAEYGLFPVFCTHGVISFCSATGSSDTGIYVGQSSNVNIEHNTAFANVSGFEIENCTNVDARFNESFDNAAGLLVFLLPGLTVKTSTDIIVAHNKIYNNNHINFAPPGGGFETYIPSGSGILLVGTDNTTIEHNNINHNNFVGIANVSTLVLAALAGIPPAAITDIEPNPDGVKIVYNLVRDNGSAAPPGLPLPAADLLWDGSGTNNCWSNNLFTSSFPALLPACK
ncbi:MAG: parallel beta-helix domain-containing protein [Ferruginibacter sp.]